MEANERLINYLAYPGHTLSAGTNYTAAASWQRWITGLPYPVTLDVDANNKLNRETLRAIATQVRADQRPVLDLFWNVIVWGSGIDHRRKSRITDGIETDRAKVEHKLRTAADASHAGDLATAYIALYKLIPWWGVAFFTKFIAFTSDATDTEKPQGIILDDRVRVAWRCLTDGDPLPAEPTPTRYADICVAIAAHAAAANTTPEAAEMTLFDLGGKVSTYTRWLEAELRLTRQGREPISAERIVDSLS